MFDVLFEGHGQAKSLFDSHNLNKSRVICLCHLIYNVEFEGLGTD